MNIDLNKSLWPDTKHGLWMKESYESGLVSVIVPTFNRSGFLVEAMDSVFQQIYRPIELLIVDDGSTDDTRLVVGKRGRKYNKDDRFRLRYLFQENAGAPAARNLGLIESRGEYIQFLDSDDLLHPEKLEIHVDRLASDTTLDFVYSGTGSFTEKPDWNSDPFSGIPVPEDQMLSMFILSPVWLSPSGIYMRRVCIALGPWDERFPRCQDWEYNIRFILRNPKVSYIDKNLSSARFHNEGRISDILSSESMIRSVLFVRQEVEKMIWEADRMEKDVEWAISNSYCSLIRPALKYGFTDLAREIANLSSRLNANPAKKYRFLVWRFLAYLPGSCGYNLARCLIMFLNILSNIKRSFPFGSRVT